MKHYVDSVTGMVLVRVGRVSRTGYERVAVDGGKERAAHRMIWEAVSGPIPDGLTINHINGIKHDNRPANLELATRSEQIAHAYRTGLRVGNGNAGVQRGSRLTAEQVDRLRRAPRGTIKALAEAFGIAPSYAYQVRAGRRVAYLVDS